MNDGIECEREDGRAALTIGIGNQMKLKAKNTKQKERDEMKTSKKVFVTWMACMFVVWNGFAAEMFVPKTARAPVLDGEIKADEWAGAASSGIFMILGSTNAATEQTEAFIMRDDDNFYVAFRSHDSQREKIKAKIKERNGNIWEDDDVEFFVCVGDNTVNYRQFVVNALGAQWDCRAGKENDWKAGALIGDDQWSVEMAVPFAYLGVKAEEGMIFRGHFCRGQKSKPELSGWPSIGSGSFADLQNSARIVLGSYKAAATREIEGIIRKTEGLAAPEALAGEKAGILNDAGKLAEDIKGRDKLTLNDLREAGKKASEIEDRKVALEVKTVRERFGTGSASNKAYLTSDSSRSGYDLPEAWATRKIVGKDFWFDIIYRPDLWKKAGLENEPFIKDSLLRFKHFYRAEEFEYDFFDPRSAIYQTLKKTGRAFIVPGHDAGPMDISPSVARRFLAEYGHRFAGFLAEECFGNNSRKWCWGDLDLPLPRTRHEAFLGFTAAYLAHDNRFRSWSLTYPEFRSWTSCETATYLDHWIREMGAPFSGQEIGADGYSMHLGMCFAFSRGAARQYEKPWRMYLAPGTRSGGGVGWEEQLYCYLSPECRRCYPESASGRLGLLWGNGPYCGSSLSLERRQLFAAYMSGVNMIKEEADGHVGGLFYVSNYNCRDIDKIDPLVKVMRDKPYHLSPDGEIRKELYDNLVKKHDRGTAYTPAALIFDRHHGFIPTYSKNQILGVLPYTEGDYMMLAVESGLFPLLSPPANVQSRATGP